MREVFEPTVRMIPAEYRSQIEPAQFFHEVLTHRWFLAEQAGHDVPMVEAVDSYIASVLPKYKLDASVMAAINADADSGVIDDERTFDTNTYAMACSTPTVAPRTCGPTMTMITIPTTTPTPPSGATDRSPNRNR